MTIIYYDDHQPKAELYNIVDRVKDIVKGEVICIPKNFDILLDCSLDQLISVKGVLDTAISMKISQETPMTNYIQ